MRFAAGSQSLYKHKSVERTISIKTPTQFSRSALLLIFRSVSAEKGGISQHAYMNIAAASEANFVKPAGLYKVLCD